jgi:hypothetical protein
MMRHNVTFIFGGALIANTDFHILASISKSELEPLEFLHLLAKKDEVLTRL